MGANLRLDKKKYGKGMLNHGQHGLIGIINYNIKVKQVLSWAEISISDHVPMGISGIPIDR